MKLGQNFFPKSSFLSIDKDYNMIVSKILENQKLLKLLKFTQKDCLRAPDLGGEDIMKMIDKQIRIVPQLLIDEDCPNYLVISMDNFVGNSTNPEFRDCIIQFMILCHPDHWNLGNFALRPYKIAGELDAMFNRARLTGIGTLEFVGCSNLFLDSDFMGVLMIYNAIHGVEDQIDPLMEYA